MSTLSTLLLTTLSFKLSTSLLECTPPGVPQSQCILNGVPGETIYINERIGIGQVRCNTANQCRGASIVTLSNRFNIDCMGDSACANSVIETGVGDNGTLAVVPTPIPNLPNMNMLRISGAVNCDGKDACTNSKIVFSGNYPGGVVLSALGLNALTNTAIVCDLPNGQQCRLICSSTVNSCQQASITCNSCNCICTGKFCPNPSKIVQGIGCPRDIPKNKRFPEIQCTPDQPPPDECLDAPFIKEDENGEVKCLETADCCSCASIECGPECKSVLCDGERSCIGVPININANSGGASLTCNLPKSCSLADVAGNNVNMINCNGQESCLRALFDINAQFNAGLGPLLFQCGGVRSCQFTNMLINNGGMLNCGGDDSCDNSKIDIKGAASGLTLDCSGNGACDNSIFTLTNVVSWQCTGNFACRNTVLNFDCLPVGCPLQCGGTQACREGRFTINNINRINCGGSGAGCFLARFVFKCVNEGCPINCNNQDACRRSIMSIENSNGLTCQGPFACAASQITVNNNVNNGLTCNGQSACRDAVLTKLDNLNKMECLSFRACRDSNIDASCNNIEGCALQCNGVESCFNANISTTNTQTVDCIEDRSCQRINLRVTPQSSLFKISCLTALACNNGMFNTMVTSTSITSIEGVACIDTESCINTRFTFDGRILSTPLTINRISCTGINACIATTFRFINAQILSTNFVCVNGPCDITTNINIICQSTNGTVLPTEACVIPNNVV